MAEIVMSRRLLLASTALIAVPARLFAATASPDGAVVYFITPHDRAKIATIVMSSLITSRSVTFSYQQITAKARCRNAMYSSVPVGLR